MKRNLCFLAALCLFLSAFAKENNYLQAIHSDGLQPGDRVPDILIKEITNNKGKSEARLSDYHGKLLILDFWATWCKPCVDMIPKMNALQQQYNNKLQILPVAYQSESEVAKFLTKLEKNRGIKENLPVVTADTELGKLFPHSQLPHLVWISGDGVVKAITESDDLTTKLIDRLLSGKDANIRVKTDEVINYDNKSPLFSDGDDTDPKVRFTVSGYKEGVGFGTYNDTMIPGKGTDRRMTARNLTIPQLFRFAYSKQMKETVLDVADPLKMELLGQHGQTYTDWLKNGHSYCVELVLPDSLRSKSYAILQKKLQKQFPAYVATLEKRQVKCLALVRTSQEDKIKTAGGKPEVTKDDFSARFQNCYLRVFIARLQIPLQYHPLPLIDETGYTGKADLELNADFSSVDELNRELAKYDLRFEEKLAELEMLVIRDADSGKP
jgi:thiol-disulfide isomerase/thioredoxin